MSETSAANLSELVRRAGAVLVQAGIASGAGDAVALAAHTLGCSSGEIHARMILGESIGAEDERAYGDLLSQRVARVPLQHLTGTAGFRHLTLQVGPGVFVPRPETEIVAGAAIDEAVALSGSPLVVDLCAGSAAIALAVKDEVPHAQVIAVELDPLALGWAAANVRGTGLSVELVAGDAASALPDYDSCVDIVVSNPPYIPLGMVPIDPEVRDHDPQIALYGGSDDGLAIPLAVACRAGQLLRAGGLLVMEHADVQGQALSERLRGSGQWMDVSDHEDLTGTSRYVTARRVADAGAEHRRL